MTPRASHGGLGFVLLAAALLALCPVAQAQPESGDAARVWLLRGPQPPPLPLEPFAAYLGADLAPHDLSLELVAVPALPEEGEPLARWWQTRPHPQQVRALVWLSESRHSPQPQSPDDGQTSLLIFVAFPDIDLIVVRRFPLAPGQAPALAPLSALTRAMLLTHRREPPAETAEPDPAPTPPPQREPDTGQQTEITGDFATGEPRRATRPLAALHLEAFPTWQLHPASDSHFLGASLLFSYAPQRPLAMLIGGSVLGAVGISHPRYHLRLLHAPLVAGIRLNHPIDAHRIHADLGILAQISHAAFSDSLGQIPDRQVTRLNVGFMAALGHTWYPLRRLGLGTRLALGVSPRVQRYQAEGELLAAPGAWFLQLGFGLDWDIGP